MFDISLQQGFSVTTMLAVAAAAVLLAGLFYWRAYGNLRRRQWQTLLLLRVVAILIIVLLLFRPVFSYYKDLKEQSAVVFVLDASSSMSISDNTSGVPRFEQARQRLGQWWDQLEGDFTLRLIGFSELAWPLDDVSQLAALAPDGKATSLSRALVSAAKQLPPEQVEAVILISDGIHNSAASPLDVAVKMGTVVDTVGVGASLRTDASYRDVQLAALDCPDQLMLNNKAKIKASVEGIGLAGRVVRVILEDEGVQLDEAELTLDEIAGLQEVEFEFLPTTTGRHVYTVRVPPVPEERIEENNRRSAVSLVIEPRIRVLYIEGTLRPEYGALVDRFFAKDPDLEFCALVQTRPNVFLKRTNIEGLELTSIPSDSETIDQFDVFIFGDLDASYIRPEQQRLFEKRVREGAGLVMLGGYHSLGPGGYADTLLGNILPVLLGSRDIGQITDPFLPRLTPDGARHPIFANIVDFFPTVGGDAKEAGLPELDGCTRVQRARPAATVLATCPVAVTEMPVLAVQPVSEGRTAVFCGDTTRKWQQGPRALDQESPFLQFWGQLVRWAAGRSSEVQAEASVVATTDKAYYEPEESVRLSATVRDERGEATSKASVTAEIRGPDGRPGTLELSAVADAGGHYSGTFEPAIAGSYEIVVEARLDISTLTDETPDTTTLASQPLGLGVGRPNLEFENLDLDEKMLSQIAAETGGRYVHITTADHLIDRLDRTQRERRVYLEQRLYWPPLFWTVFVGLITFEWILRRRFQLR